MPFTDPKRPGATWIQGGHVKFGCYRIWKARHTVVRILPKITMENVTQNENWDQSTSISQGLCVDDAQGAGGLGGQLKVIWKREK